MLKKIRSMATLVGLSLVLFALGTTGAKAQGLATSTFDGSFTLNFNAQWGPMTLPAGHYNFRYGTLNSVYYVELRGTAKGSPSGLIMVRGHNPTAATQSSLEFIREGNRGVVRSLQIADLGQIVYFQTPRGERLLAQKAKSGTNILLASTPRVIQRIAVTPSAK